MFLHIKNEDNLDLYDFCSWLISKMKDYLKEEINSSKLLKIDEYINSTLDISDKYISSEKLLIYSANFLNIRMLRNEYFIYLDETAIIPDTFSHLNDIIKLINYGNLSCKAYPIYDEMMNYFAENIDLLYTNYQTDKEDY